MEQLEHKLILTKQEAKDILFEEDETVEIVQDEIIDNSRWSIIHELIFKKNDKFWQVCYSVGATEQQDESPFEYDEEVSCTEVTPIQIMKIIYAPVKD